MIQQRRRDVLLGYSAAGLAVAAALIAFADALALIDSLRSHQFAGFQIAAGCKLLLDSMLIGAFTLGSAAFLFESECRARRLERGATVAAAGATVGVIGGAIATAVSIAHQLPDAYTWILASVVAARFVSVFAALSAASAFSISDRARIHTLAQRDRRLAWGSIYLAVSYVLTAISQLLLMSYVSDHGAGSGFTAGISVAAAGTILASGAGAIGALAFYGSQRRQRKSRVDWLSERDTRLGLAVAAFGVAFFAMGLGATLQASTAGTIERSVTAQLILASVAWFVNAIASVCAAIGFLDSRQQSLGNFTDTADLHAR